MNEKGRKNNFIFPASSDPLGGHCIAPRGGAPARKSSFHQEGESRVSVQVLQSFGEPREGLTLISSYPETSEAETYRDG